MHSARSPAQPNSTESHASDHAIPTPQVSRRNAAWWKLGLVALLAGQFITLAIAFLCAAFMPTKVVPATQSPVWFGGYPRAIDGDFQIAAQVHTEGFGISYRSVLLVAYWNDVQSRFLAHNPVKQSNTDPSPEHVYTDKFVFSFLASAAGWPWRSMYFQDHRDPNGITLRLVASTQRVRELERQIAGEVEQARHAELLNAYGRGSITPEIAYQEIGAFAPSLAERFPSFANSLGLERDIPIVPLWPGYLYTSLFWTAISFTLIFTPRLLRHHRRARRSACLRCGYTLAGLAQCPECGQIAHRSDRAQVNLTT